MTKRLAIPLLALVLAVVGLTQPSAGALGALRAPTTHCGLSWTVVPTGFHDGSSTGASLNDIDAASATEAFAVGWKDPYTSVVLRWNGTSWRRETLPRIEGRLMLRGSLRSAAARRGPWVPTAEPRGERR